MKKVYSTGFNTELRNQRIEFGESNVHLMQEAQRDDDHSA